MTPMMPFMRIQLNKQHGGFFEELAKIIYELRDDWYPEGNTFSLAMYMRQEIIRTVEDRYYLLYVENEQDDFEVTL